MGSETDLGNFEIFVNGEKLEINDFENEVIKIEEESEKVMKPVTSMKCRIKINAHDMEMALYELTKDMSIFYVKSYFTNKELPEIYKF
ncbi:MAG: hypothetical protein LBV03_04055 [Fusobacteriales bacterium]|jgi:hypothetical protein|nr:hypothetical protein [Fusobacteriales bacterium]